MVGIVVFDFEWHRHRTRTAPSLAVISEKVDDPRWPPLPPSLQIAVIPLSGKKKKTQKLKFNWASKNQAGPLPQATWTGAEALLRKRRRATRRGEGML